MRPPESGLSNNAGRRASAARVAVRSTSGREPSLPRRPFRCREKACGKFFPTKTGTVVEGSQVGYQDWLIAAFLAAASPQSVSSLKLHRDLGITQQTAWCLAQRARQTLLQDGEPFAGPVEVDGTHLGGKRKKRPEAKRETLTGRGPAGKAAVVGAKDRASSQVAAKAVTAANKEPLQGFVEDHAEPGATVRTDDASACESLQLDHDTVQRTLPECVRGEMRPNGIESLWSLLERSRKGTFPPAQPPASRSVCAGVRGPPQPPRAGPG